MKQRLPRKLKKKYKRLGFKFNFLPPTRVVYSEPVEEWYDVKAFEEFRQFVNELQGIK